MQKKIQRIVLPRLTLFISVTIFTVFVVLFARMAIWGMRFMRETGFTPKTTFRLIFDSGAPLKNTDGRTNILLLGISGGTHAGADLTDTILVLSIHQVKKSFSLISIPRDMWSDTLKDKVNSAYHYGEEKKEGGGMMLAQVIIEDITGLPMHYQMLIDFSGFKQVIDLVGGITIDVPIGFTDTQYPIEGKEVDECLGDKTYACRYQTVQFETGPQYMSAERALQYVRSRNAQGDEGTDFARGRRQQEVFVALKNKLVDPRLWLSTTRVKNILDAFGQAIDTNMNIGELATLGKIVAKTPDDRMQKISIEHLVMSPPLWMYGRYVLVPKEDFTAIHGYIKQTLQ